ncbi:protein SMAX1-LIKE 3 [Benincasa hispida]|uniref:protein SMAX1-LIKE 3 n=1 Tax=Benincasa hispida TaxID=102211 RepID=UPI0019009522|nr:protein SMAX1-LIKE 3 [Benincasa hispida]
MRTGGCTVQQALTSEALSVVKQAVLLAKRRGHAQVTPLHVASTMLAPPTGLLRTACLQSHSHPLQCKALELCFNVALNRLPASNSTPMLSPHHSQQHPSISNALVAAFKRAQAHQRRGSIENQQQPLLAVKIELEQLIISILDDPSVSRVMREARFSSTQVKTKVEQAISIEMACSTKSKTTSNNNNSTPQTSLVTSGRAREEDVVVVINELAEMKKRSVVVVGESVGSVECVVEEAIGRIEKREVGEGLKEVKFINLSISSFRDRSRVEVDEKVMELKSLIRSCLGKGVILYVGDIKWTIDYRENYNSSSNQITRGYYCPVEHMIMELGKLVYGNYVGDVHHHHHHQQQQKGFVWIMGIATFQTYMRCKTGNPSLETLLAIHPLTIPTGTLRLSLITDSDIQSQGLDENKKEIELEEEKQLNCCGECSAKFEKEARSLQNYSNNNSESTTSLTPLPAWLQQYKNEQKAMGENDQKCVTVGELYKKWNSICNSIHKNSNNNNIISCSQKSLSFSCIIPNSSSSASGFSYDHHHHHNNNDHYNFLRYTHKEKHQDHFYEGNVEPKQLMLLSSNNNHGSTPSSASSGSDVVLEGEYVSRFKELNSENFKSLCNALEKKVPWQKNVVADIASAVLQCRSGMGRRKGKMGHGDLKEETWLLFQGNDVGGKEKVAEELARVIFGSATSNLVSITLSSFSSTRSADSTEDCRNKRSRDEQSCSYIERFAEAVSINPHRVFLVEDVEQADYCSQMGFKRAIEGGRITNSNGQQVPLADAIVILSCESFSARSRACSPPFKKQEENDQHKDIQQNQKKEQQQEQEHEEEETAPCLALDLNISIDDDHRAANDESIDDVGLLDSVDRRIIFQIQEL